MTVFRPTLHKEERLYSKKLIDALFQGGRSQAMTAFPLRAVYRLAEATAEAEDTAKVPAPGQPAARLLISVPKRCFKHAVDRNRAKRQIREAYRRHKGLVARHGVHIAFIWLDSHHHPTAKVEAKVASLLTRIAERISRDAASPRATAASAPSQEGATP